MGVQAGRAPLVRTGVQVEVFTILWMVIEAVVSVGAGVLVGSTLLIAFGVDSVLELVSGAILLWRLALEARGEEAEQVERAEQRASWE
jgi:divalent metal cation (Fe/Co/Zn/Cd) transporter